MTTEQYVIVTDDENEQPIELPAEPDGTLLLSTLAAQFTGACGLKYHNSATNSMRGVRLSDGHLYAPDGVWGTRLYITVFPKIDNKRKAEDTPTGSTLAKLQCLGGGTGPVVEKKCSDLIVLGLPFKLSDADLKQYFSEFGELVLCQVKRDRQTNNSKGYGFVRFADFDAQIKCLSQRHYIDGRWCDVRIPNSNEAASVVPSKKVFVGRCTEDLTTDDLRSFFQQFGEVLDVYIPRPFRGFAFVTFSDSSIAQSICGQDFLIKSTSVHIGTAAPKPGSQPGHEMRGTFSRSSRGGWSTTRAGVGPPGIASPGMLGGSNNNMFGGGMGGGGIRPIGMGGSGGMGGHGGMFSNGGGGGGGSSATTFSVNNTVGPFSESILSAAQSALVQQGWGSFLEAVSQATGGLPPLGTNTHNNTSTFQS